MMQAAAFGNRDDRAEFWGLNWPFVGGILVERKVSARPVIDRPLVHGELMAQGQVLEGELPPADAAIYWSLMTTTVDASKYLEPTAFVDSDAENVVAFSRRVCGDEQDHIPKAVRLYYAVRDGITYTPYCDYRSPETYRASSCLARGSGFCVAKAALLAAVVRAAGIPARLGFADVRNHLCTPRLRALMNTDVFVYHGYAELHLRGMWVKATPAFDRGLCDRFGVLPLEFDGLGDSLFHPYDRSGRRHMEYVRERGSHADVPAADIIASLERSYPGLVKGGAAAPATQFREEAGRAPAD
jgi:transglutaminase-like putative cysteine protease